jgi:hypothetical protein
MTARNVRPKHVNPSFTRLAPHIDFSENSTRAVAMLDIEDFDSAFPDGVTYSDGIVTGIQGFQHALGGKTFFERLLVLLKVQGMSNAGIQMFDTDIHLKEGSSTHPETPSSSATYTSASSTPKPLSTTNTA